MRQRRGELLLLALLGILMVVASVLSVRNQPNNENDWLSGSSYSAGQLGGRGLYLWLGELGYQTETLEPSDFVLQDQDQDIQGVLWVITPSRFPVTEYDAEELSSWVRRGGTLVWIDSYFEETSLEEFDLEWNEATLSTFHPVTPWLRYPDAAYRGRGSFVASAHVTPLLADSFGHLGALQMPFGQGELWLFAVDEPFKNTSLYEEENSALVMGLLEQLPPNQPMIFDEFHHGFGSAIADWSLLRTMRQTFWGWGIYYTAILLALWLLLHGRTFGRPIPLPGEHLRREAGEYIRSMAWLYRRARLRSFVLRHHHQRLKQRVTKRYRLPATPDDAAFLHVLRPYLPDLDYDALREHLLALHKRQPSEPEVLALARANDKWLEDML